MYSTDETCDSDETIDSDETFDPATEVKKNQSTRKMLYILKLNWAYCNFTLTINKISWRGYFGLPLPILTSL